MKTKVLVTLVAEETVEIEVEHDEGDDPCDLTEEEKRRAYFEAGSFPTWDISDVSEA